MVHPVNAETESRQGLRFSMKIDVADDSDPSLEQMRRRRMAETDTTVTV